MADGWDMRTLTDIQEQLAAVRKQSDELTRIFSAAEDANPDGVVYDSDFNGDATEMRVELDAMAFALSWAAGLIEAPYESGLVPTNYAEDMCTGHGYPEKVED